MESTRRPITRSMTRELEQSDDVFHDALVVLPTDVEAADDAGQAQTESVPPHDNGAFEEAPTQVGNQNEGLKWVVGSVVGGFFFLLSLVIYLKFFKKTKKISLRYQEINQIISV